MLQKFRKLRHNLTNENQSTTHVNLVFRQFNGVRLEGITILRVYDCLPARRVWRCFRITVTRKTKKYAQPPKTRQSTILKAKVLDF